MKAWATFTFVLLLTVSCGIINDERLDKSIIVMTPKDVIIIPRDKDPDTYTEEFSERQAMKQETDWPAHHSGTIAGTAEKKGNLPGITELQYLRNRNKDLLDLIEVLKRKIEYLEKRLMEVEKDGRANN